MCLSPSNWQPKTGLNERRVYLPQAINDWVLNWKGMGFPVLGVACLPMILTLLLEESSVGISCWWYKWDKRGRWKSFSGNFKAESAFYAFGVELNHITSLFLLPWLSRGASPSFSNLIVHTNLNGKLEGRVGREPRSQALAGFFS